MAKARAILKRRKAVKNIRKITKTMQMIATAKFQKSLKRAVGTKPYTQKIRELVRDVAKSAGDIDHPLLRQVDVSSRTNKIAVIVLTANRGLAGGYNGSVLRASVNFMRDQEAAGKTVELYVAGKKGITFFNFTKRPIADRVTLQDTVKFGDIEALADKLMLDFTSGRLDAIHVVYMNFISTGTQRPDVMTLLPLAGLDALAEHVGKQTAEKEAQMKAGMMDSRRSGAGIVGETHTDEETVYEFTPVPREILDELLPLTVKTALYQSFLDASTSEHVARMVAMKAATDNAEEMGRALQLQYNRARQSQITTELSEIMGGVEAMKK